MFVVFGLRGGGKKLVELLAIVLCCLIFMTGCASIKTLQTLGFQQRTNVKYYPQCYEPINYLRESEKQFVATVAVGVAAGAATGAVAGRMITGDSTGTLIGAGAGAAMGGFTGYYVAKKMQFSNDVERLKSYDEDISLATSELNRAAVEGARALRCYKASFRRAMVDYTNNAISREEAIARITEIQSGLKESRGLLDSILETAQDQQDEFLEAFYSEAPKHGPIRIRPSVKGEKPIVLTRPTSTASFSVSSFIDKINNYDMGSSQPLSFSELVSGVQAGLTSLGYNLGPVDGKVGKKTVAAVRAFQKKNDMLVDGKLTGSLLEQIHEVIEEKSSERMVSEKTKRSYQGEMTRSVQAGLARLKYHPGVVDGKLGKKTIKAIKQFQQDHKYAVDGKISQMLIAQIQATEKVSQGKLKSFQNLQRIRECLQVVGYYPNMTAEEIDPQTRQAIMEFQRDQGLPVNGTHSESLLKKLEAAQISFEHETVEYAGDINGVESSLSDFVRAKKEVYSVRDKTEIMIDELNEFLTGDINALIFKVRHYAMQNVEYWIGLEGLCQQDVPCSSW